MKHKKCFSVLIAEDEPIILNNIAKKVARISDDYTIVGKAQSGNEALDILGCTPVDILITDIEMPGMNGLELIRLVRRDFPGVRIIVLSGYSDFEYARTALRYGVEDYLLKPLQQDTLSELLSSISAQIMEERKLNSREILSLALRESTVSDTPDAFADGGLLLFYITLGNLLPDAAISLASGRLFSELWNCLDVTRCFQSISDVEHLWLIDEPSPMQKFLILHTPSSCQSMDYFCLLLKNHLADCLSGSPFLIVAYQDMISYQELWQKAHMLRLSARTRNRPFRQEAAVVGPSEPQEIPETDKLRKEMLLLQALNSEAAFLACIQHTLPKLLSCPATVLQRYVNLVFEAMNPCFQINMQDCDAACSAFLARVPAMKSEDECYSCLEAALKGLWEQASSPATGSTLCARIAQYIESNLTQPVSLTELSDRFGYIPSYINRIFKKEYATSPMQYLTDLRMARAKEILLNTPDINIKSAAQSVGYEDARYFSRVFKNETGLTPSDWVEKQRK